MHQASRPERWLRTRCDARRDWNLLTKLPIGLTYEIRDVAYWNMSGEPQTPDIPLWRKALFMPGAIQMSHLSGLIQAFDFWRLMPAPELVGTGSASTHPFDAAATTKEKDLVVLYLAESRLVELGLADVPPSFRAVWYNPRTGETTKAGAVVGTDSCRFSAPGPGDWVLVLKGTQ